MSDIGNNADLVGQFWKNNYTVIDPLAPLHLCIREETVLLNFRRQHPQHELTENFNRHFSHTSFELGIGLKRFKPNRGPNDSHYYNAKQIEPAMQEANVDLSLINMRGLITETGYNKSQILSDTIAMSNKEHIIAITESHLTTEHGDEEILASFPNYTLHRADRDTTIGRKTKNGGVSLLTSPGILSTHRLTKSNGACELKIVALDVLQVNILLVYRPPDAIPEEFDEILKLIDNNLSAAAMENTILLGDFNFPKELVNWLITDDGVIPVPSTYRSNPAKLQLQNLLQLTDKYFLHQLISEPTNGINILDLVFTDAPHLLHSLQSTNLGISDHNLLTFSTDLSVGLIKQQTDVPDETTEFSKYEFHKANKELLKQHLRAANLVQVVNNAQSDDSAKTELITKIVECAKAANVPTKKTCKKKKGASDEAKKLFRTRTRLAVRLRKNLSTAEKQDTQRKISEINTSIKQLYLKEDLERENKATTKIKSDPKAFYNYANATRKIKTKIGPLKYTSDSGNVTFESGSRKMANILNSQYQSVFTTPLTDEVIQTEIPNLTEFLTDIPILRNDVLEAIASIPTSSAPGPDGITPAFLQEYDEEIVDALCALGRRSFDTGVMPDGINIAYITPIFKSGDKSEPANYKPVALTNHITKIYERLIKKQIVTHLSTNQLYNETQHGFRNSRSTLTNLIEYYESILLQLENNRAADSIYLDFSKAFDKCDHGIILTKLHRLGIRGKLLEWIEGFLKRRKQCVVIEGCRSEAVWTTSGVPQGSVLGPLLFLILMYDITKGITHAILSSFADDTNVWKGISTLREKWQLQIDLDLIYQWAELNNLEFNSKKIQVICFHDLFNPPDYLDSEGTMIEFVKLVKDLGIYISSDLSFDQHIRIVTKRGNQMAGWILRVFHSRGRTLMVTLLKQLVHSRMEYCCVLWTPITQELISLLESVQRNFTSKIMFENHPDPLDYWERLKELKLYSLERRRERYLIIYTWKVIHGLYPNPGILLNTALPVQHLAHPNQGIGITFNDRTGMRVNHVKESTPPLQKKSILTHCCNIYNAIPVHLRQLSPTNSTPKISEFKSQLDAWLQLLPDQPTISNRQRAAPTNSILDQRHHRN